MGDVVRRLVNGNLEHEKGFTYIKQKPPYALEIVSDADSVIYKGHASHFIGARNRKGGFQGFCTIIANDGTFIFEGFFVDGMREGPSRKVKQSLRKPGCFTIRDGNYVKDIAFGIFNQTKIFPNPAKGDPCPIRIDTSFMVEADCWKEEQDMPSLANLVFAEATNDGVD